MISRTSVSFSRQTQGVLNKTYSKHLATKKHGDRTSRHSGHKHDSTSIMIALVKPMIAQGKVSCTHVEIRPRKYPQVAKQQ